MVNRKIISNKLIVLFLIMILSSFLVLAAPGVPNQFYGEVTVNGASAPDDLFVEARVDGAIFTTLTDSGKYGFNPIFYVEDPNNDRQGDTVTFYVGTDSDDMIEAQSSVFNNGEVTSHDLSVSGLDLQSDDDVDDSSSVGSGSTATDSGDTTSSRSTSTSIRSTSDESDSDDDTSSSYDDEESSYNSDASCESDWVCGEWTECINFQQKRVCVDSNECGLEDGPETRRSCEMDETKLNIAPGETSKSGFFDSVTGFVTGAADVVSSSIPFIALVVALAGIFLFFFLKKSNARSKKRRNK